MRIDSYGELVSEIWPQGNIANLGNCMAETSRYRLLYKIIGLLPPTPMAYNQFRTETTYLQSLDPSCPKDWTVSSDQCLPWYLVAASFCGGLNFLSERTVEMKKRIKSWGFRTPDGNLISLPFFCAMYVPSILKYVVAIQALTLRIPVDWDQKVAAHLNWFHIAAFCPLWVRRLLPKDKLKQAIRDYYRIEPNSEGLQELYMQAINKIY